MVSGLFTHRRFIWQSAVGELRHRYAGTGLGVVWNVLHPLALIAVYSVVFATIFSTQAEGVSGRFGYVLYLCCGLLPWLSFAECVTRGCNAFVENGTYLRKLPIPEQIFVAKAAASSTLGLAISFSLFLMIAPALGLRPDWHWLLLPLPLLALQALGLGFGLLLGTLNVFFRDVSQLVVIALQVVLWTAPIVYKATALPEALRAALPFHPLVPPLEAVRDLFLHHRLPEPWVWAAMAAWPAATLLASWAVFSKLRAEIRDLL